MTTACLDVARACIAAIEKLDTTVRAWAFVDADRLEQTARYLDYLERHGVPRGHLWGVPVGVKDIIDVAGMPTACGFEPWKNRIAQQNAWIVDRLLLAGALIPGKTVTTQFAAFDPPPTVNPWNRDRTPGGSSSGSAAAVAAGMCPVAIGTQTGGSVLRPAAYCGIVGLKPTFGVVSRRGVFPFACSLDHVGVFARTVRKAAELLDVIRGNDPGAPEEIFAPPGHFVLPQADSHVALRVGVLEVFFRTRATEAAWRAVEVTHEWLAQAGCKVEPVRELAEEQFLEIASHHRVLMAAEAAHVHEPLYRGHQEHYSPAIAGVIQEGLETSAVRYQQARESQRTFRRDIARLFEGYDVLITPTTTGTAPDRTTTGDPVFQVPWSFTGLPTLTVPVAVADDGLPLGVQFIAGPYQEHRLVAAGELVEKMRGPFPRPPLSVDASTES